MPLPRDARHHERDHQVDEDHGAHAAEGAAHGAVAVVEAVDEQGAEDAEDGRGGTDGRREGLVCERRQHEDEDVAGHARHQVDGQILAFAGDHLEVRAADVQGVHVEGDVEQAPVQEHRHEQPPVLVIDADEGRHERTHVDEHPRRPTTHHAHGAEQQFGEEQRHVDADEDLGHRRAAGHDAAGGAPARADLAASNDFGARAAHVLLLDALGAAEADGRRDHALVADRAPAVGARHARLALRVPVAVFDLEVVGQTRLEIRRKTVAGRRLRRLGSIRGLWREHAAHEPFSTVAGMRPNRSRSQPGMGMARPVSRSQTARRVQPLTSRSPSRVTA